MNLIRLVVVTTADPSVSSFPSEFSTLPTLAAAADTAYMDRNRRGKAVRSV